MTYMHDEPTGAYPRTTVFFLSIWYILTNDFFNKYSLISHERGKDRKVLVTSGIYPWLFVTQIFHNGQSSCGCGRKTFEVLTNVHHPNRFAHKKRIWFYYLCPHKNEEMTRTTS